MVRHDWLAAMIEVLGIPLGTAFQGGTLFAIIVAAFTALGIWIKHGPDRTRAKNEGDQIEVDAAEVIRTDYAQQVKEFRAEVHKYRNELHAVQGELNKSLRLSSQRNDRINNMMFIIRLLISELKRLDPDSIVVKQAEAMLIQMDRTDGGKSSALDAAEHTLDAAQATVAVVKKAESKQ